MGRARGRAAWAGRVGGAAAACVRRRRGPSVPSSRARSRSARTWVGSGCVWVRVAAVRLPLPDGGGVLAPSHKHCGLAAPPGLDAWAGRLQVARSAGAAPSAPSARAHGHGAGAWVGAGCVWVRVAAVRLPLRWGQGGGGARALPHVLRACRPTRADACAGGCSSHAALARPLVRPRQGRTAMAPERGWVPTSRWCVPRPRGCALGGAGGARALPLELRADRRPTRAWRMGGPAAACVRRRQGPSAPSARARSHCARAWAGAGCVWVRVAAVQLPLSWGGGVLEPYCTRCGLATPPGLDDACAGGCSLHAALARPLCALGKGARPCMAPERGWVQGACGCVWRPCGCNPGGALAPSRGGGRGARRRSGGQQRPPRAPPPVRHRWAA